MTEVVLDASAVLAVAKREPGAERVLAFRGRTVISAVNIAEVYAKLLSGGMEKVEVAKGMGAIVRRVVVFDESLATAAADIHAGTRAFGLSLADCACLALGRQQAALVLTADREWLRLDLGVQVEAVR